MATVKPRLGLASILVLALAVTAVTAGAAAGEAGGAGGATAGGDVAPEDRRREDLPTETWRGLDGRSWDAEAFEGKVVVLDFWATWCAPCLAELPSLRRLDERFGDDDGFLLLGVALDATERRRLRSFLLRHDVSWPQVHEPRGFSSPIARRFAVESLPATVLLDRRGRLVARGLRGAALAAAVETLLELGGS